MPGPPPAVLGAPGAQAAQLPPAAGSGWTEHKAPDGRTYYFHKAKGVSAWEKPDEMKTEQEKVVASAMQGIAQSKWKEYTSATGKKYYFNTETRVTQWSLPEEMKAAAEAAAAKAAAEAPAAVAPAVGAAGAAGAAGGESADGESSAEAVGQFMAMLDESGVAVEASWEECMKKIINRPAYKSIATLAGRKAAFMSWQEAARERAEEEEHRRVRQIKVNFLQMLKECGELTSRTRYGKVLKLFSGDDRWRGLGDELEREELYEEYALSLERKEKAERAAFRKTKMDSFRALLDRSNIGLRSQWRKVQQQLENESAFRALEKIDRLAVFEEVVRALEAAEEQSQQKEKELQRRAERKKRDAFRAHLTEEHAAGRITYRTQWTDVVQSLSEAGGYRAALSQPGGTPAEIFDDFVDQLAQTFAAQAKAVRAVLAAAPQLAPTEQTTAAQFDASLRAEPYTAQLGSVPAAAVAACLVELQEAIAKVRSDEARAIELKRRAVIEGFQSTLRGLMGAMLTPTTSWAEVEKMIVGKPFAQALDEAGCKAAFEELVASLEPEEPEKEEAADDHDKKGGRRKEKRGERGRGRGEDEEREDDDERRHKRKKEKRADHRGDRERRVGEERERDRDRHREHRAEAPTPAPAPAPAPAVEAGAGAEAGAEAGAGAEA